MMVAATYDDNTNTLILRGTEESLAVAEEIIKNLDAEVLTKNFNIQTIGLKHAEAKDVTEAVKEIV